MSKKALDRRSSVNSKTGVMTVNSGLLSDQKSTSSHGDHHDKQYEIMSFVVGGRVFQTFAETLLPKHGTRLSWLAEGRHRQESDEKQEMADFQYRDGVYYFDRDPDFFSYVLQYYRTNELHMPQAACVHFVKEELRFWCIPESLIEPCCLANYKTVLACSAQLGPVEDHINRAMMYREENLANFLNMEHLPFVEKLRCHLRTMFDDVYRTGFAGKMYTWLAVFMTILQLIITSLMTVTPFRVSVNDIAPRHNLFVTVFLSSPRSMIIGIDLVCQFYFVIELLLRTFATRNLAKFMTSALNINDFVCNFIAFTTLLTWSMLTKKFVLLDLAFYTVRIFRVLRLLRFIRRLEVIVMTFRSCKREMILLTTLCLIGSVISGTLIYLAELVQEQPDNQMTNLFTAFYFAVASWTTVGYGDIVPKSPLSHIITLIVCWIATITFLLPIPLMAQTFAFYYRHFQHTVKRADLRGRQRMRRLVQKCIEEDPEVLYASTISSSSTGTR